MKPWVKTPLLESHLLRKQLGVSNVSLKMENMQATGSFKDRGMLNFVSSLEKGIQRIVCSSGGNAGVAAAYAGSRCGLGVHVVVPETTKPLMIEHIKNFGGDVKIVGKNWNEADATARQMVAENKSFVGYVPPFDHEVLWLGHSSMIDELHEHLETAPDYIIASVGGGGLLAGLLVGLKRHGWLQTKVIAAETEGAASFHQALKAGKPVQIDRISSIATSLGALCVAQGALDLAMNHPGGVESIVVSDKEAIEGVNLLIDEHRVLVEPACGAAVAASKKLEIKDKKNASLVVVVCGGSGVNREILARWNEEYLQN